MEEELPGKGLWGWLGRQLGYVRKAVHTPVYGPEDAHRVVYEKGKVQEVRLPSRPNVTLRRTTVDQVIVEPAGSQMKEDSHGVC